MHLEFMIYYLIVEQQQQLFILLSWNIYILFI